MSQGLAVSKAVGYNTIQINKQYTLLTVNFNDVSGEDMPVQKLFPYSEGMTNGKTADAADNIQVMKDDDSMGYDTYFMWNGKSGKGEGSVQDPADVNTWALAGATAQTKATLHKGKSMWYQSRAAKADDESTWYNITVAGSVSLAEKHEFEINKQYTLVGSPFPVEIPLNGGVVVTEPTMGKTADAADNVQIMKADSSMGYDTYFVWNGKSGGYYAILGLNDDGTMASFHAFDDPITGTTSTSGEQFMQYNPSYGLGDDKFLNDNGFTVQVGAVPEPTSGLLLLLGVAGLALRRRRA